MLLSLAWRNLSRNRRRTALTGAAVAFAVVLIAWMLGMNEGGYVMMIDQAVRTRLGHLEVLPEGYLDNPEARRVVPDARAIAEGLRELEGVAAVSPRALAEGMVARDSEAAPVDLIGVDAAAERGASVIAEKILRGDQAQGFCRERLADALDVLGGDEALFGRWCAQAGRGVFLAEDDDRAVVLGAGVAEQLLVSVGDEVTVQVVRAVDEGASEGSAVAGDLSQRRLVVAGLFKTGNAEVDDRALYLNRQTLQAMLGTSGPNEIVVVLDNIRDLDELRGQAEGIVAAHQGARVYSWNERNPQLASMIEMDAGNGNVMYFILCLLVTLGVVNATLMSVLERTRELGVMLALGSRRGLLFRLVMTEVALLGAVSVAVGAVLGAAVELFGRLHGWPLEWFGYDQETLEGMSASGVSYESIYYAALSPEGALGIVLGVYLMFLCAGLFPAFKASRLKPVQAMRER